ncbi:VOC family protein [Saccharopolyspora sp. TS4A08]|uniref:VOC family protein n=1 Tax=Saccharopolyspora ipomoeae TaxID=3042027 RepID=A0ABT6PRC5_9PSEU|nr:VOC family protein [Saccharopolyspora sp. TS4A08]MDI2030554.1 VOC family protein [Saccharopolyspora sp. TS4A08]
MSDDLPKIGNVLYPVGDVAAARQFYGECLGLGVKFTDGDRFSALDGGSTTLALAGPVEDVTGGVVAASFKVADLNATVKAVIARGGEVVRPAERGPHEVRAVVRDPWRNTFVLYSSLR